MAYYYELAGIRCGVPISACINSGCIPTKALLRAVKTVDEKKSAKDFGVNVEGYTADFEKIMSGRTKKQNQLAFGLRTFILGRRKIPVVFGDPQLVDAHTVKVTDAAYGQ